VWRVADRNNIELTAGREAKGYKRLAPELWAKVAATLAANPKAMQGQIARKAGVSRATVCRVARAPQCRGGAVRMTRPVESRPVRSGVAYLVQRSGDDCSVIGLHPDDREEIVAKRPGSRRCAGP
jgi:hypothetical protein